MAAATEQTQQEPQTQQTWHSANQRYLRRRWNVSARAGAACGAPSGHYRRRQ